MKNQKEPLEKTDKFGRKKITFLNRIAHGAEGYFAETNKLKLIRELEAHQIELEAQNEELRRAKEEAELAEKKYMELYDFAPSGYLTLSEEGEIAELNFRAAHLLGKERSYLINKRFALFVSTDTRGVFNNFIQNIFHTKSKGSCEVELTTNEDSPKYALINGIYGGRDERCLLTLVDITELKYAEAEIKKANEELIRLNAEKDKFFSLIAHDLHGPFSSFMKLTQFMTEELSKLSTAEIKKITMSMMSSAYKIYGLLENLLQWARLHQGLLPFNLQIVQLQLQVNESLEPIMESAATKEIVITNTVPDNTVLLADPGMLQFVIRNLVTNAIKFTPKGGKITLSSKTLGERVVEISVKDTGIGINPDMIKNLFRLNKQSIRNGTEGEPSSGLGLLLCKEFIEKHGGKIWVESDEAKGSTFFFTIAGDDGTEENNVIEFST